jgi:hypothetical protein
MARKPTGRPPGAPPNNINHLKHGLYSHHISAVEDEDLARMSKNETTDELDLVRSRIIKCLNKQDHLSEQDWIAYEKAVSHYVGQIITMLHKNSIFGRDNREPFLTVMDFIHQANEDQHVK